MRPCSTFFKVVLDLRCLLEAKAVRLAASSAQCAAKLTLSRLVVPRCAANLRHACADCTPTIRVRQSRPHTGGPEVDRAATSFSLCFGCANQGSIGSTGSPLHLIGHSPGVPSAPHGTGQWARATAYTFRLLHAQ